MITPHPNTALLALFDMEPGEVEAMGYALANLIAWNHVEGYSYR